MFWVNAGHTASHGEIVLEVDNLCGEGFANLSFSLREGEILGLAGVVGSGRTEMAETIYGIRKAARGKVLVEGQDATHTDPQNSLDLGLVYLPEDRQSSGLFVDAPLSWNASSLVLYRETSLAAIAAGRRALSALCQRAGHCLRHIHASGATLSGGKPAKDPSGQMSGRQAARSHSG